MLLKYDEGPYCERMYAQLQCQRKGRSRVWAQPAKAMLRHDAVKKCYVFLSYRYTDETRTRCSGSWNGTYWFFCAVTVMVTIGNC